MAVNLLSLLLLRKHQIQPTQYTLCPPSYFHLPYTQDESLEEV